MTKETVLWKKDSRSKNCKGDNIFEAKFSRGRVFRYDTKPRLHHQFFLNEADYTKITEHYGARQWCFDGDSLIHFYGGNYILVEFGMDAVNDILELLNLEIVWQLENESTQDRVTTR